MILYTQDEVEKYTRMLARTYDFIRYATLDSAGDAREGEHMLKEIERVMGWNVPPPMKARPAEPSKPTREQLRDWGGI